MDRARSPWGWTSTLLLSTCTAGFSHPARVCACTQAGQPGAPEMQGSPPMRTSMVGRAVTLPMLHASSPWCLHSMESGFRAWNVSGHGLSPRQGQAHAAELAWQAPPTRHPESCSGPDAHQTRSPCPQCLGFWRAWAQLEPRMRCAALCRQPTPRRGGEPEPPQSRSQARAPVGVLHSLGMRGLHLQEQAELLRKERCHGTLPAAWQVHLRADDVVQHLLPTAGTPSGARLCGLCSTMAVKQACGPAGAELSLCAR